MPNPDDLPRLIDKYQDEVGELDVTLVGLDPDTEQRLADLLQQAIDGDRGPVTDSDLDLDVPDDAAI